MHDIATRCALGKTLIASNVLERSECGEDWVFRARWWESAASEPTGVYPVHCAAGHFGWLAAEIRG